MMPNPHLPQEILEYIVDLLHDEPETLERCCLVSKSWVPRTRKYLFTNIYFCSADDLKSWKKTFPDVVNSPACHARTLFVGCPQVVVAADAEEGGWIQAFSGVTSLDVDNGDQYLRASEVPLTPFHKFSSTLRSLRVCPITLPHPQLFDPIRSFPLLEELNLKGRDHLLYSGNDTRGPKTVPLSDSPSFTGSLDLNVLGGSGYIIRQLLGFPNGLHFRKLAFSWDRKEDLRWVTELVARCSHTLESLDLRHDFRRTSIRIRVYTHDLILFLVRPEVASFNLSKATKLRDAVFRPESENIEWITATLQTITPEHRELRQISIYMPYYLSRYRVGANIRQSVGGAAFGRWLDLDRLLVQFWESHSIRPRVGCVRLGEEGRSIEYCIGCLLPEITKRGVVDPVSGASIHPVQ